MFESIEDAMPKQRLSHKGEAPSQKEFPRRPSLLRGAFDFDRVSRDVKHILVVDDAIMTRKMVSQIVIAQGYSVETAVDGAEGVSLMKKALFSNGRKFDAVLVDYMMPNVDGPTAIEIMKSLGFKGLIIGMTSGEGTVQEFYSRGADDVILKPISIEKVMSAFNKWRDMSPEQASISRRVSQTYRR